MLQETKRCLMYHFSQEELKATSVDMAFQIGVLEDLEKEKKEVNEAIKERMDSVKGKIKAAAHRIRTGQEERMVDCSICRDHLSNTIRVYRLDTQELIEERAMTAEERQQYLEFQDPAPAEARPEGPVQ
jgi:uncharacterized protein (UPF0335 family)